MADHQPAEDPTTSTVTPPPATAPAAAAAEPVAHEEPAPAAAHVPAKMAGGGVTKAKETKAAKPIPAKAEKKTKAAPAPAPAAAPAPATTSSSSASHLLPVPAILGTRWYVFGAGTNPTGELGVHPDELQQRLKPGPIKGLDAVEIVDIACGGMHTMALTKDGKVRCFSIVVCIRMLISPLPLSLW